MYLNSAQISIKITENSGRLWKPSPRHHQKWLHFESRVPCSWRIRWWSIRSYWSLRSLLKVYDHSRKVILYYNTINGWKCTIFYWGANYATIEFWSIILQKIVYFQLRDRILSVLGSYTLHVTLAKDLSVKVQDLKAHFCEIL